MARVTDADFAFSLDCECSQGWFSVRFRRQGERWLVHSYGHFMAADYAPDIEVPTDTTLDSLALSVFCGKAPARLLGDRLIELGFTEMGSLLASDFS